MPEIEEIDPLNKPAELRIGKKTYLLGFNLKAIAQVEKTTGLSLLFGLDWSNITVERLEGIMLAAMSIHQPKITPEEVRQLITPRNVKRIESALVEAWFSAMPEDSEDDKADAKENPLPPPIA